MKANRFDVGFLLVLVFFLTGVNTSYAGEAISMAERFYIQKTEVEKKAILQRIEKFEIGSTTIEVVKSELGPPFSEAPNFGPKGNKMEKVGSILTYYLAKQDKNLTNEKTDEYVKLAFNNTGVLTDIRLNRAHKPAQ